MPHDNPLGLDGFAFVEFTSPETAALGRLFGAMGFAEAGAGNSVRRFVQGDIVLLLNEGDDCHASAFRSAHGPSASAMGFRVADAAFAHAEALKRGASDSSADAAYDLPAIEGIGGSLLYLVDAAGQARLDALFGGAAPHTPGVGLDVLDHLTHNVQRGRLGFWADVYERVFNFREIRYFDIEGKATGLFSRAMTAPDDKIRIPLNESQDDHSQIEEFLREYKGEGIQHLALATNDIFATIDKLRDRGIKFQDIPETYYDLIDQRLPGHGHDIQEMRRRRILIDGAPETGGGLLLQIFTENLVGPIFFEVIQRKGNDGFGEGNFKALFESVELDQMRRGVVPSAA
ncbi:MAG: 4-hydroxyphenylpyruvate dioxygenase [Sphingomonadaceae bacterium]|nr:4-hydroxyphenylpyruvate dioxygenase [Sphingomonadaceae bacterium]